MVQSLKEPCSTRMFVASPEIQYATFFLLCDMESKQAVGWCILCTQVALSFGEFKKIACHTFFMQKIQYLKYKKIMFESCGQVLLGKFTNRLNSSKLMGDIRWVVWLRKKGRGEKSWLWSPLLTKKIAF